MRPYASVFGALLAGAALLGACASSKNDKAPVATSDGTHPSPPAGVTTPAADSGAPEGADAAAFSSGPPDGAVLCSQGACNGCCNALGICYPGTSNTWCGLLGATCASCGQGFNCTNGFCQ